MPKLTKLRTKVKALLGKEGTTVDDILDVIRCLTVDHPECFRELFPDEHFYGSVKRRKPASALREQMRRANEVSLVTKRTARAERRDQVKAFLADKGDNLTLPEMARLLNESELRPARGDLWTKQIVFRLLNEDDPS